MFDKLLQVLLKTDKNHKILWLPLIASALTWVGNALTAFGDGVITDEEFHQLVNGASTVETLVLILVIALLKVKR